MAQVSIFVGGIRPLPESRRPTGMYKARVMEEIDLQWKGFAGDQQADRRVHGGREKAVHLYPAKHYEKLGRQFPDARERLVAGSMGENLSTEDIDESDVRIGDIWTLGTAHIQVCQPRNPCWKIDERFSCDGMAAFIAQSLLTGWYWRVIRPGRVTVQDRLEPLLAATDAPTLREAMLLWHEHRPSLHALERLAQTPGMAAAWRDKINQRLSWLQRLS